MRNSTNRAPTRWKRWRSPTMRWSLWELRIRCAQRPRHVTAMASIASDAPDPGRSAAGNGGGCGAPCRASRPLVIRELGVKEAEHIVDHRGHRDDRRERPAERHGDEA